MLALVGFLVIIVMMLLIFKSKALPAFCFAVLPIIGALICGFSLADISDFIGKGRGFHLADGHSVHLFRDLFRNHERRGAV